MRHRGRPARDRRTRSPCGMRAAAGRQEARQGRCRQRRTPSRPSGRRRRDRWCDPCAEARRSRSRRGSAARPPASTRPNITRLGRPGGTAPSRLGASHHSTPMSTRTGRMNGSGVSARAMAASPATASTTRMTSGRMASVRRARHRKHRRRGQDEQQRRNHRVVDGMDLLVRADDPEDDREQPERDAGHGQKPGDDPHRRQAPARRSGARAGRGYRLVQGQ